MDLIFVFITGAIAWHGIHFRNAEGERETGHLLFGCIALVFCLRVLMVDLLGVL